MNVYWSVVRRWDTMWDSEGVSGGILPGAHTARRPGQASRPVSQLPAGTLTVKTWNQLLQYFEMKLWYFELWAFWTHVEFVW